MLLLLHGCAPKLRLQGANAAAICFFVQPDPEGASLAASLQEAVRAGSLSVKQAAASLASYLRQRQQQAAAAAGSASSSPGHGCRQPSSVGSSGALGGTALSPFALSGAEVRQCSQAGRAGSVNCWKPPELGMCCSP